jgi:hypothetical protein
VPRVHVEKGEEMKIEAPVDTVPNNGRGKYAELIEKITNMTNGSWLPVICESEDEVRRLYSQLNALRKRIPTKRQKCGLTLYVRRKLPMDDPKIHVAKGVYAKGV